jgi:endo-1,4-beta-mannosidase
MEFVPEGNLGTAKNLGIEVVLWPFSHDGTPESWLAYLNEAQAQDIKVIVRLWPEGWSWDGTTWQIDDQAQSFVQTVADHPAVFAIYTLEEPYWQGCWDCGYTTQEQQLLYNAIKAIADVPTFSEVDSMSFWTAQGEETAFADGICDYCATWYYPFRVDGSYRRSELISQLSADLEVARERAPNSKFVWLMQSYAQSGSYRMPTAEEMRDLASIVYSMDIDGALWYVWWFGPLYNDFLSNHPELHPVVREIYEDIVHRRQP